MHIEFDPEGFHPPRLGLFVLQLLVVVLFLVCTLRFWHLQILNGEQFVQRATENRYRENTIPANRGLILDYQGNILAGNSSAYNLIFVREESKDINNAIAQISLWTNSPEDVIAKKIYQGQSFDEIDLANNISFEQVAAIESELIHWPGVKVHPVQRRSYTNGEQFAHVLGYVARASPQDLKTFIEVDKNDTVGKQGLERTLEDRLRGLKGMRRSIVDAQERQLFQQQIQAPKSGEDLHLTLDMDLQKAAIDALGKHAGCVIVMEPETGKIRALVTAPSYDNNLFTVALPVSVWSKLRDDPRHPLHNRAIQSVYPPASIWKLIMVPLFLQEGISPTEEINCSGSVKLGNQIFRCWRRGGHGRMNMQSALASSCDSYFYIMGDRVGIDLISEYGKKSGFGSRTGINLPYEQTGLVPSRDWKLRNRQDNWQRGDTFNTSIGQGFSLVTPIQLAVYTSSLLNGGKLMRPLLVESDPAEIYGVTPASEKERYFLLQAMRRAVEAPGGTARRIARNDAIIGGKTGTAQVVRLEENRNKDEEIDYRFRDHGWLASWGVKEGKTYAVIVLVEHGGGGASAAGPVSRDIYNYLFSNAGKQLSSPNVKPAIASYAMPLESGALDNNEVINAAKKWLSN